MGSHGGSGYASSSNSNSALVSNLKSVLSEFSTTPAGNFGRAGKSSRIRVIESSDQNQSAKDFWSRISKGAKLDKTANGHARARFSDGSIVVYRKTSRTKNSPVIEILLKSSIQGVVQSQKIHFVEKKGGRS